MVADPNKTSAPPQPGTVMLPGVSDIAIRSPWWLRVVVIAFIALAVSVIWFTNIYLGDRFSEIAPMCAWRSIPAMC